MWIPVEVDVSGVFLSGAAAITGTIAPIERMVGGNGAADNGAVPMDTSGPNGAGNSAGEWSI